VIVNIHEKKNKSEMNLLSTQDQDAIDQTLDMAEVINGAEITEILYLSKYELENGKWQYSACCHGDTMMVDSKDQKEWKCGQCGLSVKLKVIVEDLEDMEDYDPPHNAERLKLLVDIYLHPATNECPDQECVLCSIRDCPGGCELHYHHDCCPSCGI
jgi:PHP family Zn ribbon phosphoesterase